MLIHSETQQLTVYINETINHSLNRFVEKKMLIHSKTKVKPSKGLYEWAIESLIKMIY